MPGLLRSIYAYHTQSRGWSDVGYNFLVDRYGRLYEGRAGGSRAFVQDIRNTKGYPHFSTIVLLHEYAHHFLISSSRMPMPAGCG